ADPGDPILGRVPDPEARVVAPDLDGPELRVYERAEPADDAAAVVVAIPAPHLLDVLAGAAHVVEHEGPVHSEPCLPEEVPDLADHRDRAELLVRVRAELAAERFVRLVGELLEAADHGVAGVLLRPRADLVVEREVVLIHAVVALVAAGPDVAAP